MLLRQLYNDDLAQASYLVGCQATGEAIVIDPNRAIDTYIAEAARHGLTIAHVTETHIHADFVSGARELAAATGAKLYLSAAGPAEWQYHFAKEAGAVLLKDGDTIKVGNVTLDVMHTPGHTPEHISFVLTDRPAGDEPVGIFTGDFLFVGDVGRPDLLEKAVGAAGTMEGAAKLLYQSLKRLEALPDFVQVFPGHGAGSACGKSLGALPQSTLGYERRTNWALRGKLDEAAFVAEVLANQPPPPLYFATMKHVNQAGPQPRPQLQERSGRAELERLLGQDVTLVDVRSAEAFAAEHIPGARNIPAGGSLLRWAGWFAPTRGPVGLIGPEAELEATQRTLQLIGVDAVVGAWPAAIVAEWAAHHKTTRIEPVSPQVAAERIEAGVQLIDVRNPDEYAAGHIPGATNVPLHELPRHELPTGPVLVHCQGGTRSAIAASLLSARHEVYDLRAGYAGWSAAGLPTTEKEGQ